MMLESQVPIRRSSPTLNGYDLVVSSLTVPGMERTVTGLKARGVRQAVLAPKRLEDVLEETELVGAHLGVEERARAVCEHLCEQKRALERMRVGVPTRVYLEWWPRPIYTPGADCYSNSLIELAGGVNVFVDRPGSSVEVTVADIVAADPDVCFVSWCGVAEHKLEPQNLGRRAGLEHLRAVRNRRVFALDERFAGRPGPLMLEAARRMAHAIHRSKPAERR